MRIFQAGRWLVTSMLRRIRIDGAGIDMKFGLGHPAATSQAIAAIDVNGDRTDMDETELLYPTAIAQARILLEKLK